MVMTAIQWKYHSRQRQKQAPLSRKYASNPRASSHFRKRDRAQSIITLPEIPAGTAKPLETRPPLLDVIERCYTSRGEGGDDRE